MNDEFKLETFLMHHAEDRGSFHGAITPPIFQNSLFAFKDWEAIDDAFSDKMNHYIYSRGKNPTTKIVEEKLALLAGGERAQLFPSGMAAITASCLHFLGPNDHVIAINNIYGPANNLLKNYLTKKLNISTTFVTGKNIEEFKNAIQNNTKLIYLESPSSAIFSLQDIRAVTDLAKANGIKTIIDNTWATPIFQKPLEIGVDLEIHSCTKYIGGHSDLIGGVVIGSKQEVDAIFLDEYELLGAKTAPIEAWLILRSLRTLPIRLERHQHNAMAVAEFLENHPKVKSVQYPGLKSFSQYELGKKQMSGYTGLMSFRLKTPLLEEIKAFVNGLKIFQIGVSWGGHESLVYVPAISYFKEMDKKQFDNLGISMSDIRISVGLEHKEDLIRDLELSLENIM